VTIREPEIDAVIWRQLGSLIEVIYADLRVVHRRGDRLAAAELAQGPDFKSYPLQTVWPSGSAILVPRAFRRAYARKTASTRHLGPLRVRGTMGSQPAISPASA